MDTRQRRWLREVAAAAETGELVLFHHDPAYTDDLVAAQESTAQKLFPDSRAAYEGCEIKFKLRLQSSFRKTVEETKGNFRKS